MIFKSRYNQILQLKATLKVKEKILVKDGLISVLGTIHLRRQQIFMIFDPYTLLLAIVCIWPICLLIFIK